MADRQQSPIVLFGQGKESGNNFSLARNIICLSKANNKAGQADRKQYPR